MKFLLSTLILVASVQLCFATITRTTHEKHHGKVYSILGEYEGDIYIKLNEENDEMIEIEMGTTIEKSKGSKKKTTSSIKLNAAAINRVVIDSVTYKIRNIEQADGKYYKNCCIKEVSSNTKLTLYAWGNKTEAKYFSLWIKGDTYPTVLKEIRPITAMLLFTGCNEFKRKMREKQNGYFLEENITDEERLAIWLKWISETKDCIKE
ncbi:MAG: hypothetical protein JSR09_09865 [Bacteroidetes bacterium]|nr:hypothetical protein [Bacteroidota bacterium]MBS1649997.1 hypothetical protein [Bacteroidota bacterium]